METVKRTACRGVIITKDQRILLVNITNGVWSGWITPGGGINPGEDKITALKRELREELGLVDFVVGPVVWTRFGRFAWRGRQVEQHDTFYLIRVEHFAPSPQMNPDAHELVELRGFRWWGYDEIAVSQETFVPRQLYRHLIELEKNGPPATPIAVEG